MRYRAGMLLMLAGIGCWIVGIYFPNDVLARIAHPRLVQFRSVLAGMFLCLAGLRVDSLDQAREFLKLNGVGDSAITTQEATTDNRIPFGSSFGLIISLISWGFHYPVTTYLSEAARVLASDGSVILDVRKGTNGLRELRSQFSDVRVISEKPKFLRLCARR